MRAQSSDLLLSLRDRLAAVIAVFPTWESSLNVAAAMVGIWSALNRTYRPAFAAPRHPAGLSTVCTSCGRSVAPGVTGNQRRIDVDDLVISGFHGRLGGSVLSLVDHVCAGAWGRCWWASWVPGSRRSDAFTVVQQPTSRDDRCQHRWTVRRSGWLPCDVASSTNHSDRRPQLSTPDEHRHLHRRTAAGADRPVS